MNYVNSQVNFSNYFLSLLIKKTMVAKTPDQLAKLALAREKALEIRKANAEINRREKELKKLEKDERAKSVNEKYNRMKNPVKPQEVEKKPVILQEETYDSEPEPEPEPVVVKQKAKPKPIKKKKKVIVVQQEAESSSEEEEEEIVYVTRPPKEKKTKKIYAYKEPEPPVQQQAPIRYSAMGSDRAALVHRMFSLT